MLYENKDWLFPHENTICNFRSAGLLFRDGKILVQRDRDGTEYALPGGHVAFGETGEQALKREFKEETGVDIFCERMIWVEESFWKWGARNAHTLCFYYLVSLEQESALAGNGEFFSQKDDCTVVLKWLPLEELEHITIYPRFLKEKIRCLPSSVEHIEHFVSYE